MDIKDLSDLVKVHGDAVYGFCYALTKCNTDTDDLYQETFLKAMELCHKIDKNNNPKSFLISIAIGLWKNNRRKYARRQKIAPTEELNEEARNGYIFTGLSTPEDITISKELRLKVRTAVDMLNDKYKIPLYMFYTVEMSNQEIAASLKIPVGTVKSRLNKARKTLKNILEVEVCNYEGFQTI